MPHIHTKPGQHDYTVTMFIVRIDGDEPRALVHMHRKIGRLLPIGGHVELDETPWQAVRHELSEESGYALHELKILQPKIRITCLPEIKVHPYPVVLNTHDTSPEHSHTDIAYAFVATADPLGIAGDGESLDLRWLTKAELENLDEPDIYLNTKMIYNFVFDVCIKEWDAVPASAYEL